MSFLACPALSRLLSSLTHCLMFFLIAGSDDLGDSRSDVDDLALRKRVDKKDIYSVRIGNSLSQRKVINIRPRVPQIITASN